jgi:uncharacterized protein (DUF1501 family)
VERRTVIKALLGGLVFPVVPLALEAAAKKLDRRLILIELQGANDGLNTVVPYRSEQYRKIRPNIYLKADKLITMENDLAFNFKMKEMADIYSSGELAVVLGLGYPGSNRSHFKSIALWETGGDGTSGVGHSGWLTDDINGLEGSELLDAHGISLDGGMGVFASSDGTWISMTSIKKFQKLKHHKMEKVETNNPALSLLLDRSNQLNSAMESISKKLRYFDGSARIRGGELGDQLELALNCISAGINSPVIKVSHGSFDTHDNQSWRHNDLLEDLSMAIFDTRKQLVKMDEWHNTIIMTYSEFGRTAYENASEGTDHGTAAPHFLIGGGVKGGFYGKQPSLNNLKDGDMIFTTDYRSFYDTILSSWFSINNNKFSEFNLPGLQKIIS